MGEVEKGAHALAEEVAARRRAEQLAAVAMADARRSCAEALLLSVDAHARADERAQEARAGMRSLSERVEAVAGQRAEAAAAAARVGERLEAVHAEQERAQELQLLERSASSTTPRSSARKRWRTTRRSGGSASSLARGSSSCSTDWRDSAPSRRAR